MIFPHLFGYLTSSEFLKCRLVSKEWKGQVDHFLVNHEVHRVRSDVGPSNDLRPLTFTSSIKMKNLDVIIFYREAFEKFLRTMSTHRGNPFVTRSISITFKPFDIEEALFPFVTTFGWHIWHLDIFNNGLPLEFIENLEKVLAHFPNLRKLSVYGDPLCRPGEYYEIEDVNDETGEPYNMPQFKEHIKSQPFPKMPYLETLELTFIIHPISCQLYSWIISPYTQTLKRLHFHCENTFPFNHFHGSTLEYSNLMDLKLKVTSNLQLENLSKLQAPLRRLYLHMDNVEGLNLILVSQVLTSFHKTLRSLALIFTEDWDSHYEFTITDKSLEQYIPAVELPQLKTLELTNCLEICSKMSQGFKKTLEYLHIYWEASHYDIPYRDEFAKVDEFFGNGEASQVCSERGDLKDSSIWRECRRLRKITIEQDNRPWENCTREMYEYEQEQKNL